MTRDDLVGFYLQKLLDGSVDFHRIRRDLESKGIPEEDIRAVVKSVDNEVQLHAQKGSSNSKSSELIYIGLTLASIGALITIVSYVGIFDLSESFYIVHGSFFSGISILGAGLVQRNQVKKRRIKARYPKN